MVYPVDPFVVGFNEKPKEATHVGAANFEKHPSWEPCPSEPFIKE